jgi:hypothetical protein
VSLAVIKAEKGGESVGLVSIGVLIILAVGALLDNLTLKERIVAIAAVASVAVAIAALVAAAWN